MKIVKYMFLTFWLLTASASATPLQVLSITVDDAFTKDPVRYSLSSSKIKILEPGYNALPTELWPLEPGKLLEQNNCLVLQHSKTIVKPNDKENHGNFIIYKADSQADSTIFFIFKRDDHNFDAYVTFNLAAFLKMMETEFRYGTGFELDTFKPLSFDVSFNPFGGANPISIDVWVQGVYSAKPKKITMEHLTKGVRGIIPKGVINTGWKLPEGFIPCLKGES